MSKLKIEYMNINDLKTYERNAKVHTEEQIEQIKESIRQFGMNDPIAIWRNNEIIEGHGRLIACQELGIKEVPVLRLDGLSDKDRKAYMLAHNKITMNTEFDERLLELELLNLDVDMSKLGFNVEQDLETEKKEKERDRRIESMELKAFEHYDYVVFIFKNQMDWLNIINEFDIKKVDAGYGKTKKIGVGRVIDGKRLLEKIRH